MARLPARRWMVQPFVPRRFLLSLAAALVLVPALALATKAVVEAALPLRYEIHWLETVPLLVAGFALVIHGSWNQRSPPRPPGPDRGGRGGAPPRPGPPG